MAEYQQLEELHPLVSDVGEDNFSSQGSFTTFPPPRKTMNRIDWSMRISNLDFLVMVFLPSCMFLLVVLLFVLIFYEYQWLVWSMMAMCFLLGILFILVGIARLQLSHLAIGLLCLAAACTGAGAGFYIYVAYASSYWSVENGAVYKHVEPSTPGSKYADASLITFTPDSIVDFGRSLGYMEAGSLYCVAPIIPAGPSSDTAQYWAAGWDCCGSRGDFKCGDVRKDEAKGGVRIFDDREQFSAAVRMAESVYQMRPSGGGIPVLWTVTDERFIHNLFVSCMSAVAVASAISVVCSFGAALAIRIWARKNRDEGAESKLSL